MMTASIEESTTNQQKQRSKKNRPNRKSLDDVIENDRRAGPRGRCNSVRLSNAKNVVGGAAVAAADDRSVVSSASGTRSVSTMIYSTGKALRRSLSPRRRGLSPRRNQLSKIRSRSSTMLRAPSNEPLPDTGHRHHATETPTRSTLLKAPSNDCLVRDAPTAHASKSSCTDSDLVDIKGKDNEVQEVNDEKQSQPTPTTTISSSSPKRSPNRFLKNIISKTYQTISSGEESGDDSLEVYQNNRSCCGGASMSNATMSTATLSGSSTGESSGSSDCGRFRSPVSPKVSVIPPSTDGASAQLTISNTSNGTVWVQSPDCKKPHLELNFELMSSPVVDTTPQPLRRGRRRLSNRNSKTKSYQSFCDGGGVSIGDDVEINSAPVVDESPPPGTFSATSGKVKSNSLSSILLSPSKDKRRRKSLRKSECSTIDEEMKPADGRSSRRSIHREKTMPITNKASSSLAALPSLPSRTKKQSSRRKSERSTRSKQSCSSAPPMVNETTTKWIQSPDCRKPHLELDVNELLLKKSAPSVPSGLDAENHTSKRTKSRRRSGVVRKLLPSAPLLE